MLAAAFSNPFTKVKSISQLYEQVSIQSSDGENSGHLEGIIGENYFSLLASAEASIQLLETGDPESLNLLYFLGCLPGGVRSEQLKKMFGDDKRQQLHTLKKLSFLDASQEPKIAVITFITSHVNNTINSEDKEEYMKRIC